MRPSTRRALLWRGIGLLCYLGGLLLFLPVALGVVLGPAAGGVASRPGGALLYLLASVALLVLGRVITWKLGGEGARTTGLPGAPPDSEPEQSTLERLGYRMPPAESDDGGTEPALAREADDPRVVCRNCGAENDPEYGYCRGCSAELDG